MLPHNIPLTRALVAARLTGFPCAGEGDGHACLITLQCDAGVRRLLLAHTLAVTARYRSPLRSTRTLSTQRRSAVRLSRLACRIHLSLYLPTCLTYISLTAVTSCRTVGVRAAARAALAICLSRRRATCCAHHLYSSLPTNNTLHAPPHPTCCNGNNSRVW